MTPAHADVTTPGAVELTAPAAAEETAASAPDEVATSPEAVEMTTPAAVDVPTPAAVEETTPAAAEETAASAPEELATSPAAVELRTAAAVGVLIPAAVEETTPAAAEVAAPAASNGQPRLASLPAPHVRRARGNAIRRHRRLLLAIAIVIAILAASGLGAVFAYTTVKAQASQLQADLTVHLQAGQSELEAAKVSLTAANAAHDENLVAQASVHFTTAKVQFMVARQIADSSQLLHRLETLPAFGDIALSRHAAVVGIADMGIAISDAGMELAKLDGLLIKPAGAGGQQGRTLLTVLEQANSSVVIVRKDLERAQQSAAQVDVRVVPIGQQASLVKAKGTIGSAIAAVDEFQRLVPVLTELLGGNGARTYLIEQVNSAELRPGGGFLGSYSVLQADHGALKLVRSGDAVELIGTRKQPGQAGYVAPPGPLHEFVPNTSWSFIDSNFFPDFPANAAAGETFAQPFLGTKLDGVISIDYYAVAKMLELTGPLAVPGYGITVTSTNFIPLVVQYDIAYSPAHKAILSAIAGTLMNRVATLPPDRWPALIGALNDLSAARHLQAYFNNASVQNEIDQVGWSGTLNIAGARDYMMEVESNLSGNKTNYFLTRNFTIELTRTGNTLHHKVTIDLVNNMPFVYRPSEYYVAYLRLYVSDTASSTRNNLRPAKYPNPAPPAGTRMIDGWVPLFHGYGHSAQAVFEYDTPWVGDGRGLARIYWQKQPGTLDDKVAIKWNDGSGHVYTVSGDLAQDRVITFSSSGVSLTPGQPARAKLPSLSLG